MKLMGNLWCHILDLKVSIAALLFGLVSISNLGDTTKVIAGLVVIGFTLRRWYIMENKFQNKNNSDDETSS